MSKFASKAADKTVDQNGFLTIYTTSESYSLFALLMSFQI